MRVITGRAKGRRLFAPSSNKIRPALDKVKESIFNILFDVNGLDVLDIFAGTGSVGIEAISRGAHHATFIENMPIAIKAIEKNLSICGFAGDASIIALPMNLAIKKLSKKEGKFDLVFVDPPYLKNLVNITLRLLSESGILKKDSIIVVEHHPKEPIEDDTGLVLLDYRKYGQTLVSFLNIKKPALS